MEWSFYVGPTIFVFLYFFHTWYTSVDSYYIEFFLFYQIWQSDSSIWDGGSSWIQIWADGNRQKMDA
jgi:hypothetical protein